jgi:hypothetical protein
MAKRRRVKRGRSTSTTGRRRKIAKLNLGKLRREIKALDRRREREPDGMRAAHQARGERQERRRALAEKIAPMIAPMLAGGGDVRKARAMLARHNRETAADFRNEEATAKKAFTAGFKSRRSILRPAAVPMTIAGPSPGSPVVHTLTPILIWAKPAWTLVEADYGTVASGARAYTYFSTSNGNDEIDSTFWYLWTNSTPYPAVINATCTIGYRGLSRLYATSAWFYGGSAYLTEGQVELQVYEWWKPGHPRVTRPGYDLTPNVLRTLVSNQGVEGGAIWEFEGQKEQLIHFRQGHTLRYNTLLVPPNGSMVFAVRTHFKYIASGSGGAWGPYANVSIDFAYTPGYSIWIPSFTVAVQNPLPPVDPGLVGGGGVLDPG